jgi:hypothetical protein
MVPRTIHAPPTGAAMDCWEQELEKARTEAEVLQSATDYLQLWAPRELDPMNLGLVELRIESPDDIERVRRSLKAGHTLQDTTSRQAAHLRQLASYLGEAAQRVTQLRAA